MNVTDAARFEKMAREIRKDMLRNMLYATQLGHCDTQKVAQKVFSIKTAGGGSSIIDIDRSDYTVTDAPKELAGVKDVETK